MAKIHAVIIDAEVENEETIRSLLSAIQGTPRPAEAPVITEGPLQLASPVEQAPEQPPVKRAYQRKQPVKHAPIAAHESEAPRAGGPSIVDRVQEALRKRPMSSMELIQFLKVPAQTVYTACSWLKSKGVVESKIEGDDETRRWYLK
jgi:hypothetical protein